MAELLIRMLRSDYKVATLSRGYKRKTKGFGIANENTTALEIGDEPMQFHRKFPEVIVAVGEERLLAIPQLLQDKPLTEVIILDDAYQHRKVKAGLTILLTECKNLYTRDFLMPAGDLRDARSSAARADIIIVTKCNKNLLQTESKSIKRELNASKNQAVYFTSITYGTPYHLFKKDEYFLTNDTGVFLVCGIANPKPLKDFLTEQVHTYDMLRYQDHHIFDSDDLLDIKRQFEKMKSAKKIILTTEKDGVRMQKFKTGLADFPIYVIPIQHEFLFNEAGNFRSQIIGFIESFTKPVAAAE